MLTYVQVFEIFQSFDENQLKQPAMIHIKDSEYVQQAQQVVVSDDDNPPVIIADICIQFEEE
ncbi:flagellar hook-length control protein [Desulfonatronospira sp.]|uniref:flagellar hook-length control protein n=1 Tax=Desulfonatronospira sp. TaxID=1962951 RepID=UPI0025C538D5|nr:flagellar hook-length control protein [Desulfonatronospira sp.]